MIKFKESHQNMSGTKCLNIKYFRHRSEIQEIKSVIEIFRKEFYFDIELNWFRRIQIAIYRRHTIFLEHYFIKVKSSIFPFYTFFFVSMFVFHLYCEEFCMTQENKFNQYFKNKNIFFKVFKKSICFKIKRVITLEKICILSIIT